MSLQDVMDLGKEPASLPALLNEERFGTPETDTILRTVSCNDLQCILNPFHGLSEFELNKTWTD